MAEERSVWREYLEALIIAAIFLLFTNTFVIQTFYIPSGSMEDTLLIGDHLFVNRFVYGPTATPAEDGALPFRDVHRGDIVVFRSPEDPKLDLVKRCIAVGGDTVEIIDQQLHLNGKPVNEASYVVHKDRDRDPGTFFGDPNLEKRDNYGPYQVPAGHYFCMGDNRDNSYDSRFWGPVPAHLVKGRVLFIYWSYGGRTSTGFESPQAKLRNLVDTALGFFTKTRWDRTFRLIR
ncbi:MAG TPA: signal peptidase I [Thermoanaerobaculia bacterium]|nr:signal peptidase I [Thermoanaerobaculia bacterium]